MDKRLIATGALALALLAGCGEDTAADYNQRGNDLFAQGQYGQALTQYKEAALLAPDRVEPIVNVGNTRYELQDYLGAIEAPKEALNHPDPVIQAMAYYNKGNAHFRLQEYEQSINAYKETLRRTPDDADAKYNLELAQKLLQQQQQQQQQQANGEGQQQQPQPQPDENGEDENGEQQQQPEGPGQDPRPTAPPSSLTPEEAQRELDRLRRAEGRRNEDTYDNYAVGGDPEDGQNGQGDTGW
ncbi:MAG TPA: tetratricopeptide repeat protein [Herpetosiphonaceae bacterium]